MISSWPKLETPVVLSMPVAAIAADIWPALAACLSSAELARAAAFHHDADRRSFTAAHALLRLGLGTVLDADPLSFEFRSGPYGKPELAGHAGSDIRFNISHSRGMAVVGLARGAAIGVDTEPADRLSAANREAIVRVLSSDEQARLAAVSGDDRLARVVDLWTLKEAVVKALGRGLSFPLASFAVDPDRLTVSGLDGDWRLALWMNGSQRIAAALSGRVLAPVHVPAKFVALGARAKIFAE